MEAGDEWAASFLVMVAVCSDHVASISLLMLTYSLRIFTRVATVIAFIGVLSLSSLAQTLPSRAAVLSVVSKVNNYWIQQNPIAGNITSNWSGAVYMIGGMHAYDATLNANYLNYVKSWADYHQYALYGGDTTRHADHHTAGQVYIRLYELLGDSAMLSHINTSISAMVAGTRASDWWWCDALHMAMPTFAKLGQINNNPAYAKRMYDYFNHSKRLINYRGLYSTTDNLWWRDRNFIGTNTFWARGNAWVFVAHAKVLEILPTDDPHYLEYLGTFQDMAARLLTLQGSDGFWRADLKNPTRIPNPETSGTAGFVFGLAWGIRAGVLDDATYRPVVTKAWNGMVSTAVHSTGKLGYVQPVGNAPSPATFDSTSDFGVGLFLMAGDAVAALAAETPPPPNQVAAPLLSPSGGVYTSAQSVSMRTTTTGATIRYTLDGRTPSPTVGTVYTAPITVTATTTIQAIAYKSGMTPSEVTIAGYTISPPRPAIRLEAESMTRTSSDESVAMSDTDASGGSFVIVRANAAGDWVSFTTPSIPAGSYELSFRFRTAYSQGRCAVQVDGRQVGGTVEQYSATRNFPAAALLGRVTFATAGTHIINVKVAGKSTYSAGYEVTADEFILTPR
jgi:rhamnogalacturonyl hydrolase YesR